MIFVAFYMLASSYFPLSLSTSSLLAQHELTFLIISQGDSYNFNEAVKLKNNIILQSSKDTKPPTIYLSHETFDSVGSWAITPIILANQFSKILTIETKWIILCEDQSVVDLKALIGNLQHEDETKEIFLGHPLRDEEATIIHHFAFFENPTWFLYPLFRAGVAISVPLLNILSQRLNNEKFSTEFFIDASHELSLFAWNNGQGHKLSVAPYFCVTHKTGCAIYSKPYSTCNKTVPIDKIFFAVKTCEKFHDDRIPVIRRTWANQTKYLRYYSDKEDLSIPTISTNIPNTENGHCQKVLEIFQLIHNEIGGNAFLMQSIEWVVLADDDTLLSVSALTELLGCYEAKDSIYLGERYGYRLQSGDGFNYITGGGGIVFSINLIDKLIKDCTCPTASSPDDMIIAMCLQKSGILPIHSARFHQARPIDYPIEILQNHPISFHKFWQIDPYDVYDKWFNQPQRKARLEQMTSPTKNSDELSHQKITLVNNQKNQNIVNNNKMCRNNKPSDNVDGEDDIIKISTSSIKHVEL